MEKYARDGISTSYYLSDNNILYSRKPTLAYCRTKRNQAQKVLQNIYLTTSEAQLQIEQTKAILANEHQSSWSMLWQPGILKAVIIGVCIAMLGQFMGVNAVLYYGPSIFEDAGLSGGDSLFYQILIGTVNMVTGVLALLIIDKIGRKNSFIMESQV